MSVNEKNYFMQTDVILLYVPVRPLALIVDAYLTTTNDIIHATNKILALVYFHHRPLSDMELSDVVRSHPYVAELYARQETLIQNKENFRIYCIWSELCEQGESRMLERLLKIPGLKESIHWSVRDYHLYMPAVKGHVDVVRLLRSTYQLTREHLLQCDNLIISGTASAGQVAVMKVFVEEFGLTASDLRLFNNRAFRYAREHAKWKMAEYIVSITDD